MIKSEQLWGLASDLQIEALCEQKKAGSRLTVQGHRTEDVPARACQGKYFIVCWFWHVIKIALFE